MAKKNCGRAGRGRAGRGAMTLGGHPAHWRSHPASPGRVVLLSVLGAWTLAWKGASLWHAAKDGSKPWFVALLLSNTVGILDALYVFRLSATHRTAVEEAAGRDGEHESPQPGHRRGN